MAFSERTLSLSVFLLSATLSNGQLLFNCQFNTPTTGTTRTTWPDTSTRFFCGMTHTNRWTIDLSGGTPSGGTGPSSGTLGGSDNYAHIETSTIGGLTAAASLLTTPTITMPATGGQLRFSYHMFGATIGTLSVSQCTATGACSVMWTRSGQQHSSTTAAWTTQTLALSGTTRTVRFSATRGTSFTGDISVDAIMITGSTFPPTAAPTVSPTSTAPTQPPPQTLPYNCGFNTPATGTTATRFWCGMSSTSQWRIDQGGTTPSFNTGPSGGQAGTTTDNYAHIETSGGTTGTTSILTTPQLIIPTGGAAMTFYYHMFGATIGSLSVSMCTSATSCGPAVWTISGQQHTSLTAAWTQTTVAVPAGTLFVRWTATRGTSFTGDISIDTVSIFAGTAPPTAGPTPTPQCFPAFPTAFFVVTAARPLMACAGGGGPQTATEGTCYTTTSGSCITDGPGNHGNNERCTINIRRTGWLAVQGTLALETFFDYFRLGSSTTRLQTNRQLDGLAVTTGQNLTWFTDASVTRAGFTICGTTTVSPTPAPPAPVSTFTCGFNSPSNTATTTLTTGLPTNFGTRFWCGMSHTNIWQVDQGGSTPSFNTGPSSGQAGTTTDNYAHIETSSGSAGMSSVLTTPPLLVGAGGSVLSYYYHMFGATVGSLVVRTCAGTVCTNQSTFTGQQHTAITTAWTRAYVNLPAGTTSVQWVATRGTSFTGDISIDTISIAPGTAPPTAAPTGAPTVAPVTTFTCGFNTPSNTATTTLTTRLPTSLGTRFWCGMSHTNIWQVDQGGSTPSFNTGPSGGQAGTTTDNYAHIETSSGTTGMVSVLTTPPLLVNSGGAVLSYYYHMFGATVASLQVRTCAGIVCTNRSTFTGAQHTTLTAAWSRAFVTLPAGTTSVQWVATRGTSFTGDISIDTISITPGGTAPPSVAPTPTPACVAAFPGAYFTVTAASPVQTCTGGAGPTSAAQGTCYTTTSGTCITDGPGNHGNNERCTFNIQRTGVLFVQGTLSLERFFDYFSITGSTTRLQTNAQLNGLAITSGQTLRWQSDGSVVNAGYTLCASSSRPPTAAPTTTPVCAAAATNAFFVVSNSVPARSCVGGGGPTTSASTCYTTTSGTCFTDGPGNHGNNERCVITVQRSGFLSVSGTLSLERFFDYFRIGTSTTRLQTRAQLDGRAITAGQVISWFSDGSVTNSGFTLCGAVTRPPTAAPTAVPACAAANPSAFFVVSASVPNQACTGGGGPTTATSTCYTTNSGMCFTDGPGNHGNNERCTITVQRAGFLYVPIAMRLGTTLDYFTVGSSPTRLQTAAQINGIAVTANQTIAWRSDAFGTNTGFTICGSTTGAPTPAPPPPVSTFSCDFNTPSNTANTTLTTGLPTNLGTRFWCGMSHTNIWQVDQGGSTPSFNTGPSGGQAGTTTDNYAHIETSSGTTGMVSVLTTPPLSVPPGGSVLSYYYHMFGATIGSLQVRTCVGTVCTTRSTFTGAQHTALTSAWTQALVPLAAGTTSVQWVATRGTSFTGDISIDTISISPGGSVPPTVAPTGAPTIAPVSTFTCGFNTPSNTATTTLTTGLPTSQGTRFWCGMSHTNIWQVDQGGTTPSFNTGPSRGQAGTTTDNYAHIETSSGTVGMSSVLTTPPLIVPVGGSVLSYYYHMFGATIASLQVRTCTGSVCTTRSTFTGQQHTALTSAWTQAFVSLPAGTTSVQWVANRGTSFTGDISIDTISITPGGTVPPTGSPTGAPTVAPVTTFNCGFNTPSNTATTTLTTGLPTSQGTRFWCGMSHTNIWQVDQGGSTPSFNTGPSGGQAGTTTDNYAHIETSFGTVGMVSVLTTPPLIVQGTTSVLSYYYHMFGATVASLQVRTCAGSVCTNQTTFTGAQHTSLNAPWTRAFLLLPIGTTSVQWVANRGTSFTGDISIDTISIAPGVSFPPTGAPTLPAPTSAPTPLPVCGAAPTGAFFVVSSSSPARECAGGGGPITNASTCYTTTSGTCFTDGPGNHGNNERCVISVQQTGFLSIQGAFSLETFFDYFRIGTSTVRLQTRAQIEGRAVSAGQLISWISDSSVTNAGFTICGSANRPPTAAPTALQACPAASPNAFFVVSVSTPNQQCAGGGGPTTSASTCYTTTAGTCFTDGTGNYGNNERCVISVQRNGYLAVQGTLSLERFFDYFTYGVGSTTRLQTNAQLNGLAVTAGSNIIWTTDASITRGGFTICGTTSAAPTVAPPAPVSTFTCDFNTPNDTATTTLTTGLPTSAGTRFWCGMTHTNIWNVDQGGSTPSVATGPSRGQAGTLTDNYAHLETSVGTPDLVSVLTTPPLSVGPSGAVLSYYYHMFGATIGSLQVRTCVGTVCTTRSTFTGAQHTSQTAAWTQAFVSLASGTTSVQFVGNRSTSFTGDISVDTISITPGGSVPPTVAPTSAPTVAPVTTFTCGFNTPSNTANTTLTTGLPTSQGTRFWCGMSHTNIWQVDQGGSTPSFNTGPSRGQAGTTTDNYAHIETSSGTVGMSSVLTTPPLLVNAGGAVLSYYYHMFGATIASLQVRTCAGSVCTTRSTFTGPQHTALTSAWTQAFVSLPAGTTSVQWVANRGTSFTGDISIDTISITPGGSVPPTVAPTGAPTVAPVTTFTCAFNSPSNTATTTLTSGFPTSFGTRFWCGMSHTNLWNVDQGGTTPSVATGPSRGQAGTTTDNYAHLETSFGTVGMESVLTTPPLLVNPGGAVLSYYYHMFGANIASLVVRTCAGTVCTNRSTFTGAQHTATTSAWTQAFVSLPAGTTSVQWVGSRGTSFNGDISIDTISITPGGTVPPTGSPTPLPACSQPANANAMFRVSAASPLQSCSGGLGPSSATEGTCFVTTSGTCFTDGPGNHGNDERCTIQILRSGTLSVQGTIALETFWDYLTLGSSPTRLGSTAQIQGLTVTAGQTMSWFSDTSVTFGGFTICGVPSGTVPPVTAAPVPAAPVTAAPVTAAPVTAAPVTGTPVTATPVTHAPVSFAPTTSAPVILPGQPTTHSPTSLAPTTAAPTTPAPITASPTVSPTARPSMPPTRAPNTLSPIPAQVTSAPNGGASASSGGSSGGGSDWILWVVIVLIVAILVVVGVVMWAKGKGGGGGAPAEARSAFNNPLYSDAGAANAGGGNPLYDDGTEEAMGANDGYMDLPPAMIPAETHNQGDALYTDAGDALYDESTTEGDGGASGYMDVSPQDEEEEDF